LITVPFLTALTAGCTGVFSEVVIVALEPEIVVIFAGTTIFVGIVNVVVFVTSPLEFVVTPGRALAEGVDVAIAGAVGEGEDVGVALVVGFGEGAGDAVAVTVGEGEADGEAEAVVVSVDPPPPPPNPPPPPELPPELPLEVADALGVGVGEALGATVAIGAAVTLWLPDSVENGLIPTPLVDAIFAVYVPVAREVKVEKVSVISVTTRDIKSAPSLMSFTVNEISVEPPLLEGGSQLTRASPAVPVPATEGALITVGAEGMVTASDLTEVVPEVFAELIAVIVNSADAPAVNPMNS
jgi:hypothetical protein